MKALREIAARADVPVVGVVTHGALMFNLYYHAFKQARRFDNCEFFELDCNFAGRGENGASVPLFRQPPADDFPATSEKLQRQSENVKRNAIKGDEGRPILNLPSGLKVRLKTGFLIA